MFKRLVEGDLPESKGQGGDDQPNLLEEELRSPKQVLHSVQTGFNKNPKSFDVYSERKEEEEVPLVWRKKGVRGGNALTVGVPDLEAVEGVTDTKLDNEPTKSGRERKCKGKGKMVESHTKGDKKRYVTRGEVQKVIESVIAGNEIQTERNIKRRRDGHVPKGPASTPLPVGSSETESDDIAILVVKRNKEAEIE
ncbi:hypothetical protein KY285_035974 [Solanum tuberosum]|nr:hypothetical protein KY285_035974 [Solanum tuberosum]